MNLLGNLIWLIMGGLITALMYWVAGILLCLTIIGIPFGVQLFKIGNMVLWPFGHDLVPKENASGCLNIVFNIPVHFESSIHFALFLQANGF